MNKKIMYLMVVSSAFFGYLYFYASQKDYIAESASQESALKLSKFIHNKLWRDTGPARMEAVGSIVHVTILDDNQYREQLGLKLMEEAAEVCTAQTKVDRMSEIGDVLEVIDCIITFHGLSLSEINAMRDAKREERGSFLERKFVTTTESVPGSFLDLYCSKDPDKYQKIVD